MEGLEISELLLSEVFKENKKLLRLEAEYLKKEYLEIERRFMDSPSISSINAKITCGPFGSNLLDTLYLDSGVLVVRPFNLKKSKVEDSNLVYIREADLVSNNLKKFGSGTLLFSRVGDIKIGVLNKKSVTISPNIIAAQFEDDVMAKFLCVFYQTYYGFKQIERQLKISAQPTISTEIIGNLKFPSFTQYFREAISLLLEQSFELDKDASIIYERSHQCIINEIGLEDFEPSHETSNVKSFKESFGSSGRLDAEYYQAKYDELESEIIKTGSYSTLGKLSKLISRGKQPLYSENDSKVLTVINSKHVRENKIIFDNTRVALEDDCTLFIEENDVLINGTGVGTIGRAAPYLYPTKAIPDNHVTIIRQESVSPLYLSVYLNTIAGQYQVEKYFKGSSGQIELYPDDISNFLIWIAPKEVQDQIEEMILSAFKLENESNNLLEVAKRAVELAIEESEEVAMEYIQSNSNL